MLVAFVAPKQSGKTTACNILKDYWGANNVAQVNFKDGLITEIKEKFPDLLRAIADKEYTEHFGGQIDALFVNKPPLIRALLQNYGTEVRRGDNPNYWIQKYGTTIDKIPLGKNILTDDVRFKNEAETVKFWDGILIHITRTDLQNTDTHQSETEQVSIQCDHEIVLGYGEQDKLKKELIKIVKLYE